MVTDSPAGGGVIKGVGVTGGVEVATGVGVSARAAVAAREGVELGSNTTYLITGVTVGAVS